MLFFILGGLLLVALAGVLIVFLKRRRQFRHNLQRFQQLLRDAEHREDFNISELSRLKRLLASWLTQEELGRYEEIEMGLELIRQYNWALTQGRELIDDWRATKESLERLEALTRVLRFFRDLKYANQLQLSAELEFDPKVGKSQLQEGVNWLYDQLLAASENDRNAFFSLYSLIKAAQGYSKNPMSGFLKHKPEWPPNWNSLVARHIKNPNLKDFELGFSSEVSAGEIRLRAAAALRDGDLTEAKIVLAYCNRSGSHYRQEVGDYLAGDLAKMVAAQEKAKEEKTA